MVFEWIDKFNNIDDVSADDINDVAHEVIRLDNDKVDKVIDKGLSTEDYTTDEKTKLSGIDTAAQVNVLEGVQVNGTDLAVANKKVNIDLSGKQDVLTFDSTPTENSTNPVTSGGVYNVTSYAIAIAEQANNGLNNKQDLLTFDSAPTQSSGNPVMSGGVYAMLQDKQDKVTISASPDPVINLTLENNHEYIYPIINYRGTSGYYILVTLPSLSLGYCSCLRFTTPSTIETDYSSFPNSATYKGDDVTNGVFTPQANTRYTMLFDYDGSGVVVYISGKAVS